MLRPTKGRNLVISDLQPGEEKPKTKQNAENACVPTQELQVVNS